MLWSLWYSNHSNFVPPRSHLYITLVLQQVSHCSQSFPSFYKYKMSVHVDRLSSMPVTLTLSAAMTDSLYSFSSDLTVLFLDLIVATSLSRFQFSEFPPNLYTGRTEFIVRTAAITSVSLVRAFSVGIRVGVGVAGLVVRRVVCLPLDD